MFEWMNRHKKDIMTYTLYLVIPSFIVLYGYGECASPQQYAWMARVNDNEIYQQNVNNIAENLQRNARQQTGESPDFSELQEQALATAIHGALIDEKADQWGIATTDDEVARTILQYPAFQDEQGRFNINYYRNALANAGMSDIAFEEMQRENLTSSKVQLW